MKRLVVVLAGVAAMMLVATVALAGGSRSAVSSATAEYGTWGITLHASVASVQVGDELTLFGTLTNPAGNGVGNQDVTINGSMGEDTLIPITVTTQDDGYFANTGEVDLSPGDWSFTASAKGVTSDPVVVTVVAGTPGPTPSLAVKPPPPPSGVFLCYSAFQTDPGVWPATVAASLMAQGYWSPYAVKGNVDGATNVGGYHLVCNLAAGQAAGQQFAGGDGYVPGADVFTALTGAPGWYPVVP